MTSCRLVGCGIERRGTSVDGRCLERSESRVRSRSTYHAAQCPPLGGPVSRLLPCRVSLRHLVRNPRKGEGYPWVPHLIGMMISLHSTRVRSTAKCVRP